MKTFNYRLFKETEIAGSELENIYTIRTVYYDKKGIPISYGDIPVYPVGSSITELKENLAQIKMAFTKATLTEEDFI